jgi:amino acid transporter
MCAHVFLVTTTFVSAAANHHCCRCCRRGCCCCAADFSDLINMVSISTLFAFWIVALALLWHRCFTPARHSPPKVSLLCIELFVMVAACIGEYHVKDLKASELVCAPAAEALRAVIKLI